MPTLKEILDSIPQLSSEDRQRLRAALDAELRPKPTVPRDGKYRSKLIGLFADEPELIDEVLEAAYEQRALPLRTDELQK